MSPVLLSEWHAAFPPLHAYQFFYTDDPFIGPLFIALSTNNSRSAAILALCGSFYIPNLSLSPNDPFFPAAQHLPPSLFDNLTIRALSMAMLRYFAWIPENVRRKARIFREHSSQVCTRGVAFDEMHAADIAQRCEEIRTPLLQSQINKPLENRVSKELIADLVLPDLSNNSPLINSFLSIFTDHEGKSLTGDGRQRESIASSRHSLSPSLPLDSHAVERRKRFFYELVSTEERYVDRLVHLIKDYVVPLRQLGTPSSSYDLKALFPAALDQIARANSVFYKEIKDTTDELELVNLCHKHFCLFAPLYTKFLEASLDFEVHLENLLRQSRYREPKSIKDHTMLDLGSCSWNQCRGCLVIQCCFRVLDFVATLTSDILALTPSSLPLHKILIETIAIAKRISTMERKEAEKVSATYFALKTKITGFPDSIISANRRLVDAINAQYLVSPDFLLAESIPVTLVIFTDCIAILQRAGDTLSGAPEILQCRTLLNQFSTRKPDRSCNSALISKKDFVFRGWVKWEHICFEYGKQQDSLWMRLSSEVINPVTDSDNLWIRRPERKFIISGDSSLDVEGFMQTIISAKLESKTAKTEVLALDSHSISVKFAVYKGGEQYKLEDVKSDIAIICELGTDYHISLKFLQTVKVAITLKFKEDGTYNLSLQSADEWVSDSSVDQIPTSSLPNVILEQIVNIQRQLVHPFHEPNIEPFLSCNEIALSSLVRSISQSSPVKSPSKVFRALSRPSSPIKVSTLLRRSRSKTEKSANSTHSRKSSSVEYNDGTKEQRIIQAIETFIQRLITDEDIAKYKLFQADVENTQIVRDLCESLVKDPKRHWAVEGSPFPVTLASFVYLLDHIFVRKYGYVISTSTAVQLLQKSRNIVEEEEKRTVLKEILEGIGKDRWRVFSAFTKLLLAYFEKNKESLDNEPTLAWAARLLAGPINKDIFLPVLSIVVDAGWHMLLHTSNKISRASSQVSSATSVSSLGYSLSESSHTTRGSLKSHKSLSVMSLFPTGNRSSSLVSNETSHKRSFTSDRPASSLDEFGMRKPRIRSSTIALSESTFHSKLRIDTGSRDKVYPKSLLETDTIRVVSPEESDTPTRSLIGPGSSRSSSLLTPTPSNNGSDESSIDSYRLTTIRYDSKDGKENHTSLKASTNSGTKSVNTRLPESRTMENSVFTSLNIRANPHFLRNPRPLETPLSRGQRLARQQQEMREKRIYNTEV